jgi:hypothetical protein
MEQRGRQTTQRSRSWSPTAPATLPNEENVAALPCIQHILDANRLIWPDVGQHPDCPFASFIHASQQQEPTCDLITDTHLPTRASRRVYPYRKLRNAPDPGRFRRRRRFQTRKPLLLFLAFSTYLTRIAAPGPMLASIQIVHLRASSTPVNIKNQHVTQSPTRQGNSGTGFDLTPPDDFFPEAWTKRCNGYSIFQPGLVPPR